MQLAARSRGVEEYDVAWLKTSQTGWPDVFKVKRTDAPATVVPVPEYDDRTKCFRGLRIALSIDTIEVLSDAASLLVQQGRGRRRYGR